MSKEGYYFFPTDRGLTNPGIFGRIGRLIFGLFSLWFVRESITFFEYFVSTPAFSKSIGYLVGVAIAYWVLPDVVNIGFNRRWGNRSQKLFILVAIGAILFDLLVYASWWGPPLGWVILVMAIFTHLYLGLSHILAAVISTPGCEMRSLPHLWALINKQPVETVVCPGHWEMVDQWEAKG